MKQRNFIQLLVVGSVVLTGAFASVQSVEWMLVNWKVRNDFPTVPRIGPKEVAAWLGDANRAQPALLDVRTKPEFDFSHIHGAQRVDPDAAANAINLLLDQPIVTYCSVGYRSGAFAKKLQEPVTRTCRICPARFLHGRMRAVRWNATVNGSRRCIPTTQSGRGS